MLRIAVLGVGRIGRMHAANIALHPRAALAGVFDVNDAAATEIATALGTVKFASAEEAVASEAVDALLIASSTATHADFIEMGVAAGKPVLCEKPIDLSLERVETCAAKIAGSPVPVMLGFVRRFDTGHRAVKAAIEAGRIGDLHQLAITSRDPGLAPAAYIEVSGGIFRDMTIHDFDLARYFLGEEIATVSATGSRLVDPALMERCDDYDTVTITMATAGGKQCVITNSRRAVYGYDQRVEAFGSGGMIATDNKPLDNTRFSGPGATGQAPALLDFFIERYDDAFAAVIGEFVGAAEAGRAPAVGFEDGRQALILAEAALLSVREGRTVSISDIG
ncbi:inositol 2-dehydrogenase [Poseidonocella sp. HB161398]|uniref:inositol 2-dehydrogenase n=1 Tax=Poseidonocella sp. HB161398 TaxID=2320855 RepID=UPI0011094310|nr:inositol 2-dehydrogenase [Poseidonocella sp. HB161398]